MRGSTIRRWLAALALGGATVVGAPSAHAAVPPTITNQGRLFDASDQPIQGPLTVLFAIYDADRSDGRDRRGWGDRRDGATGTHRSHRRDRR